MQLTIKRLVAAAAMAVLPMAAIAEDWKPAGPIKLMIAFGAGGGADTQARLIAEGIEAKTGWSILPEQVTGNSGLNLLNALKDEPADGTAIGMVVSETLGYVLTATPDAGLDVSQFTPLATTAGFQMGLVAMADGEFNSWDAVKAAAEAGQTVRIGAASSRQADLAYHLGKGAGIDFNIVEVKGGKAIMNGLNAGDLDVGWVAGAQSKAVKNGDMVNIARAIAAPLNDTPDAPAITELGSDFLMEGYFMMVGPGDMDPAAREALANAINDVLTDSETKAAGLVKRAFGGATVITGSDLEALLAQETEDTKALLVDVSQ